MRAHATLVNPVPALTLSQALFLDVDGTLLDIAARPSEVEVSPHLTETLRQVYHHLKGALALVSGRSLQDLDRLFHPLCLPAAGQHGAEIRLGDHQIFRSPPFPEIVRQKVISHLETWPGIEIEDKGHSLAIHYRQAPDRAEAVIAWLRPIATAHNLRVLPGKMVWELHDPSVNKGTAIAFFLRHEPFRTRTPIFIGDDITDQDGFDLVTKLGGSALPVGERFKPHRASAFATPEAVRCWLTTIARQGVIHG